MSSNSAKEQLPATNTPDVALAEAAVLLRAGEFQAAIGASSTLLRPEATGLRAVALAELGRLEEAIETVSLATPQWRPGDPEEPLPSDLSNRAQAERELDFSLAHYSGQATRFLAEANAIAGLFEDALRAWRMHWLPASEASETGHDMLSQIAGIFEQAIAIAPQRLVVYRALARMLLAFDADETALNPLARALAIDPASPATLREVARTHIKVRDFHHAQAACEMLLEFDPEDAEALCLRAQALYETNQIEAAAADAWHAVELQPSSALFRTVLGNLLTANNQFDEAHKELTKAVTFDPLAIGAHSNIWMLERFRSTRSDRATIRNILSRAADPYSPLYVPMYYALGQQLEGEGETAEAFRCFTRAAAIQKARTPYNEEETLAGLDRVKRVFDADFLRRWQGVGDPSKSPIFIVGMPRSGSTLIEQVISSHRDVHGAGELTVLGETVAAFTAANAGNSRFPEMVLGLKQDDFRAIARGYLAELSSLSGGRPRGTDKCLSNGVFAGLIHLCLPNARIVYAQRNPVASCWSIFKTHFRRRPAFANDLAELGRYTAARERLMAHWREVLPPDRFKVVQYEAFVGKFEDSARDLLDFLDLPWDDRCLAFNKSTRPVLTASVVQVRQPIYQSSVASWQAYKSDLQPLIDALSQAG